LKFNNNKKREKKKSLQIRFAFVDKFGWWL